MDRASLLEMQLPEIRFTVDEILPPGLTVFAGAPKVGKSSFVLNLCLSVATGQNLWCFPTRQGTVLYHTVYTVVGGATGASQIG